MVQRCDTRPLIAHIFFNFAIGGLENGVVNLINHLPHDRYRHAIVCIWKCDYRFVERLKRDDVQIFELKKKPGIDPMVWWRVYLLLRQLTPDIVHTRNLSALEALAPAFLSGVPVRIHSEHGRDINDLGGNNRRYQWLRRLFLPFAHTVVALSKDLADYLLNTVGISSRKLRIICNGVDCDRFVPSRHSENKEKLHLICVSRLQAVKDPMNVLRAFSIVRHARQDKQLHLSMVGDGPLFDECMMYLQDQGLSECVTLTGAVNDVPQRLQQADIFVLGSRSEGISNTVLEAMASGLPVVATRVGGNCEIVRDGETGFLADPENPQALADAMLRYVDNYTLIREHSRKARQHAVEEFSLHGMMQRYQDLYDDLLPPFQLRKI